MTFRLQAVERLHAQAVTGQQHAAVPMIIDCQSEDAVELAQHVASPAQIGGQQHFGIPGGAEAIFGGQLTPEFAKVVDFAVKDDRRPASGVRHRLHRGFASILDSQTCVGQG